MGVGKTELEFFDTDSVPWAAVPRRPGVSERILARDAESGLLTRIVRWDPGLDTSDAGPVVHKHFEEVLILSGSIRDLVSSRHSMQAGLPAGRRGWFTDLGPQRRVASCSRSSTLGSAFIRA